MLELNTSKPEITRFNLKTMPINKLCRIVEWNGHIMYNGDIIIKTNADSILQVDKGKGYWWTGVHHISGTFVVELLKPGDTLTVRA